MKLDYLIFVMCISAVNSFILKKIDDISGTVEFVEFAGSENVYIGSTILETNILDYDEDYYHDSKVLKNAGIYKLNSKGKITANDLHKRVNIEKIFTISDNAYLFCKPDDVIESNNVYLYFLGRNMSEAKKVFEFNLNNGQKPVYFKNRKDQIYFNTAMGVAVLEPQSYERKGSTIPHCINNLEYFSINNENSYAIDEDSNIYLGGKFRGDDFGDKIAVIRVEEQNKLVPSAEIQKAPNSNLKRILEVTNDPIGLGALISYGGDHARIYRTSYIFISKGPTELLFGTYSHEFTNFYTYHTTPNIGKSYFFARNLKGRDCFLNHVREYREDSNSYSYIMEGQKINNRPSYTFSSIPNVNFKEYNCERARFSSAKEGNVFFHMETKNVFLIKNAESEIDEIIFPGKLEHKVTSIIVDDSDRLWILAGDLYMVPKHLLEARRITNSSITTTSGIIKIHPKTGELFIGSDSGLYIYSD